MNRNVGRSLLVLVVVCLVGIVAWKTWPRDSTEPQTVVTAPLPKKAAPTVQTPAPPEAPPDAGDEAPEKPAEPPAEAPKVEQEDPFGGGAITAETLTGCKYTQDVLEIEFAANGEWKVNGKVRAKWEIVGNRVRMYDDKGEEHSLDIVNNKLMFNGEEIQVSK